MSYGEKFYEKVDAFENHNAAWFWTALLYGLAAIIERLDVIVDFKCKEEEERP